jgi:hypothetical protein
MQWRFLLILSFAVAGLAAFLVTFFITIQPITSVGKYFLIGVLGVSWGYAMQAIKTRRASKSGTFDTKNILLVLALALLFGMVSSLLGGLLGATWTS